MQKIFTHKYATWIALGFFAVIVIASSLIRSRFDLTAEKRFSLSNSTNQVLAATTDKIDITVFLTGDLPTDYKKLNIATADLLEEFRENAGSNINYHFEMAGEGMDDSSKFSLYDSLARMGIVFENTESVSSSKNQSTQQVIIPSALVSIAGRRPIAVDLRSSRKVFKQYNIITENPEEDVEATRNAAEALLEHKFISAIDQLTKKEIPTIAYAIGNGEPAYNQVADLVNSLRNTYRLGIFNLKDAYPDPKQIQVLMVVKPTVAFTDEDKLKLDQYIMNGGKIIWLIDKLYADLDSLMKRQTDYVAYDRGLNIDDILFKYGVRINGDLLQDLNCSKIPIVIGSNADGSPRMQRLPWPYYPFLNARTNNPISKNLDRVLPIFPSSIDTVKSPGITKTLLLATDSNSRRISTPALVSLNSVKSDEDLMSFNKSYIPVAVLLEGQFKSLFANRLTATVLDSVNKATGKNFSPQSVATQQIVISDADIATNAISNTTGPLPMGMIPYENYRFANREFMLNCIDYLANTSKLYESRNKEFVLRLLDKKKVETQKALWQFINIGLPVALTLLLGFCIQWMRKRSYAV